MASIYDLKPKFQTLLRPLCRELADAGVTANAVTVFALVLSFAFGAAVYFTDGDAVLLFCLPLFLFARMALNAIDGMLAREFGQKTDLGAFLNEISDVAADAALYLPFAAISGVSPLLTIIVVVLAVIIEMTGVVAVMIGAARRYDGPFGKSDRAVFFGGLGVLFGAGLTPGRWTDAMLVVAILLSCATIAIRTRAALKETRNG